jgi:hypothetical protein
MEKSELLREVLVTILLVNGVFILFIVFLAIARGQKRNKEFELFLNKNGFKINALERDLVELLKDTGLDYGESIYTKTKEITMQCEDYNILPFEYLEKEMLFIKTNKNLSKNQKLVLMNTLVLGFHYLIKNEEVFNCLLKKDYTNEHIVSFTKDEDFV